MKKTMMFVIALALAGTVDAAETIESAAQEEMNTAGVARCTLNCPQPPAAAPPATRAPAPAPAPAPQKQVAKDAKKTRDGRATASAHAEATAGVSPGLEKAINRLNENLEKGLAKPEVKKVRKAARDDDDGLKDVFKGWKPKYGASAFAGTDNFFGLAANVELDRPGSFVLTADLGWVQLRAERLNEAGLDNLNRIYASAGVLYRVKNTDFRVGIHGTWIGRVDPYRDSAEIGGVVIDYDFGLFKAVANLDHNFISPDRRRRLEPVVESGFVPSFAIKASF